MSIRFVLTVVAIEAMVAATPVVAANCCVPLIIDPIPSYLDNGVIRVGVDLARGGTITYLSQSIPVAGVGANVVNSFRLGREVQQAYWSGPDNYGNPAPPWAGSPWNANAAGDTYGNPSTVLEQTNDGKTIYTKTIPKQWALDNVDCECVTEQWIRLNGNAVQGHNRLTNHRSDHTQYPSYGQNLPAALTNGPLEAIDLQRRRSVHKRTGDELPSLTPEKNCGHSRRPSIGPPSSTIQALVSAFSIRQYSILWRVRRGPACRWP
jgi:hypothetical protein